MNGGGRSQLECTAVALRLREVRLLLTCDENRLDGEVEGGTDEMTETIDPSCP
jgi:hypothetical protein